MHPSAESLLAGLLAGTSEGVLAFDREFRYRVWNSEMERISGMPAARVLGRVAFEVFPFLRDTGEIHAFEAALRGEVVSTREQRFAIPETQREGLFEATYVPVRDGDQVVTGGLAIIRDVTQRRAADIREQQLRDAEAELQLGAERLTLALHASRLGPWEWDAATDVVTFSDRAAEIFGIEPGPRTTWTQMRELLHPDDREATRIAVERAVRERAEYDVEYRVLRPAGGEVWIAAMARALYDSAGEPLRMLGVVQDISARKQIEQNQVEEMRALEIINRVGQLLVSELELPKVLQALTDAATELCGAQFGAFFYNAVTDAGESYMLYTLSGAPREAFSKFPMPRNTGVFAPTFNGERIVRSDDITRDPAYGQNPPHRGMPEGHLPVRSYLALPVLSGRSKVIGGLFFGHDRVGMFTARHERILAGIASQAAIALENAELFRKARSAEQHARERAESLALADRHKDDFLAMLAHELRNPLGAVSNAVHVMARATPGDTSFERAIQIAQRQISHQQKLVDDLLDVSRIARGKIHLVTSRLDLARLLEETIEDHRPAITAAGLRLELALPEVPLHVEGDRVRLAQVIGNLLDNARKFTRAGGSIRVEASIVEDRQVGIRVVDDGIGVDPAVLPWLFTPFAQAERTLDRSRGGLGLGLALAKGLVELHGGRIEASSAGADRGTEFRIAIPLASPREATAAEPARAAAPRASSHVLVIDDLHDAADTLRDLLQLLGCTVDVAYDARAGLEMFHARRPDLVLCDLGLPGDLNGFDFARLVRAELGDRAPSVRLIALTGYGAETDQRASLEAGFDLHLTKPIRPEDLMALATRAGAPDMT